MGVPADRHRPPTPRFGSLAVADIKDVNVYFTGMQFMKLIKSNTRFNLVWFEMQWRYIHEYGVVEWVSSVIRKVPGLVAIKVDECLRMHPGMYDFIAKLFYLMGLKSRFENIIKAVIFAANNTVVLGRLVNLSYQKWSESFDTPTPDVLDQMRIKEKERSPVILIVIFNQASVCNAGKFAQSLISSVGQPWQAVFVFPKNCNSQDAIEMTVAAAKGDNRIVFEVQETFASKYIILVEGTVLLRSHALCTLLDALSDFPKAMLAYADEDKLSNKGIPCDPWFKPEFSRLLSSQGLLLGKLLGVRSTLIDLNSVISNITDEKNTFAEVAHRLALTAGEDKVLHIPHVLAHDMESAKSPLIHTDFMSVVETDVTIIIPTRDRWELLGNCLESIWKSDWITERLKIIVVDNGSTDVHTLLMLEKLECEGMIEVLRDANEFNWSRLNNLAAHHSSSEVLIFLNNDTEVLDPSWIRKLAARAIMPSVGAVGCKLLYPDFTVQHAGVILGPRGGAVHAHVNLSADNGGYHELANQTHEVSAVTGACLAISRDKFIQVGGFNEDFKVAFNDIEFCIRVHNHGYHNIYLADAILIHHECKTRGHDDTPKKLILQRDEARRIWLLHHEIMRNDPFYSPNLSFWKPYELAFLPRYPRRWRRYENRPVKVMLLSNIHVVGDNKTVATAMYAQALQQCGYDVVLAGPVSRRDYEYPGCKSYPAYDHLRAAFLAAELSVDIIVVLSSKFYSIAKWTGAYPVVISIDFGDPPPDMFSDAIRRRSHLSEKELSLTIASAVYAVSDSVAKESRAPIMGILSMANSHMQPWTKSSSQHRSDVRSKYGWNDKVVVIATLYNWHEDCYAKGIDRLSNLCKIMRRQHSCIFERMVFVLYVEGGVLDIWKHKSTGFCILSNLSSNDIYQLFCAVDLYLNLSRWDGIDWGLLQARAVGLPILATNIAAHHGIGAALVEDDQQAADWLVDAMDKLNLHDRKPDIISWKMTQDILLAAVESAICF